MFSKNKRGKSEKFDVRQNTFWRRKVAWRGAPRIKAIARNFGIMIFWTGTVKHIVSARPPNRFSCIQQHPDTRMSKTNRHNRSCTHNDNIEIISRKDNDQVEFTRVKNCIFFVSVSVTVWFQEHYSTRSETNSTYVKLR